MDGGQTSASAQPHLTQDALFQVYSPRPMATFYDLFVECEERWPENIALEIQRGSGLENHTYGQLRRMAESVGKWLSGQALEPGSRCAILAENHPRWVAAYLGIIAAGHTAVPLDTAFHSDQVAKLVKDSGSVLIFCDSKHLPAAEPAVRESGLGIVLLSAREPSASTGTKTCLDDILAAGPEGFRPASPATDSVAAILYTSGTTADPKGVMLTHGNMLGEVAGVRGWADLGPSDAVLGILPLFHSLAQMANLLLPLVNGARVVYLETLNTTELLRALRDRNITAFAVVPQFYYLIHERIFKEAAKRGPFMVRILSGMMRLNHWLRKLGINAGPMLFGRIHETFGRRMRYLVTGGSRFDPQIGNDFYDLGIDVLQAYGLTETCGGAFAAHPTDNVIGSVGKPLPGVTARIVDPQPQESGPPTGEVAIQGPIVMKGYWNRPDATEAVLRDGWLYTGDIGYLDEKGNLFLTGRKKEVIVLSNGKNVYPEEIETHYLKSPFIKEICVMGLEATPGDPMSDRLYAVVVPNFETLKERKIVNAKEVIRFDIENLSSQIASTKRVAGYEIWQEDLARTTTRKIKRFEIEKRVRANQGKADASGGDVPAEKPLTQEEKEWLESAEVQRALAILKEASRSASEIRPSNNLELDLGLDSMQRVELLVALENDLGGDIPESEIADIYTVRQLVDAVRASAKSGAIRQRAQLAGWDVLLREEPDDPALRALIKPRPVSEAVCFGLTRLLQLVSLDLFHLKVEGLENLPTHRPVIISSNHQSFIDPVVLASVLPWDVFRRTFAVGTSEIFGSGFMRRLADWIRVVVVDPDANLVPAMRAAAFGLRHGRTLILYPEGERSIDGTPKIFRKGAAILSIHMQAPIVPVAIEGFYEAWPRGKYFFQKLTRFRVKFGEPIYPPREDEASEAAYDALTTDLKARVVEMWRELQNASG
jgi:long-chain acyl-CoA synthetase